MPKLSILQYGGYQIGYIGSKINTHLLSHGIGKMMKIRRKMVKKFQLMLDTGPKLGQEGLDA